MSASVTHRVVVRTAGNIDREAAGLGWVRLQRRDGDIHVECALEAVDRATSAFARAGLHLETSAPFPPPQGLVAAVVAHLLPFRGTDLIDVVTIHGVTLGEATAWVRARRWPLPHRRAGSYERLRALLRGDDVAFRWRRLVFADRAAFRSRRLDGARPVVFDRDALDRWPDHVAFASAGSLAGWMRQ